MLTSRWLVTFAGGCLRGTGVRRIVAATWGRGGIDGRNEACASVSRAIWRRSTRSV